MTLNFFRGILFTSILAACLFINSNQALSDDRTQPINITADSAIQTKQETRYIGNVLLHQGSLQITADELTVTRTTKGITSTIATGSPVTLIQQPIADQLPIEAEAERMEYQYNLDKIRLTGNPKIEQNGVILTGMIIDYHIGKQQISAQSNSTPKKSRHVKTIIPANRISHENNSNSP